MTPIKAEFELTAADFEELSRTTLGPTSSSPIHEAAQSPLSPLLVADGFHASLIDEPWAERAQPCGGVAMTVLFLAFYVGLVRWAQRRSAERTVGKPWSCTVNDTTAQWSGPYGQGTLPINSPIRWRDLPNFIILARQGQSSLIIPKRALTAEQLQALRSTLEANAPASRF